LYDVIARRAFSLSDEAIPNSEEIVSGEEQERPRKDIGKRRKP
jgi:hypothetical protein